MALSFRQISYFIATADAGKLSLAAANLNISQSAITSAIKSLKGGGHCQSKSSCAC